MGPESTWKSLIIGRSQSFIKMLDQIEQVASTETTVLITGETGTGKELVARAVHELSRRKAHSLVKINCAVLPPDLIESELFGHEKGAFTGAVALKKGKFELADGSSIFLDEIGDLPLALQAKLLRVLQEGEFDRLGNPRTFKLDVRVIAATNRILEKLVLSGDFRRDLYYRLNVFPIRCPSLRERPDDIPELVRHFIDKYSIQIGKKVKPISRKTMRTLQLYHWPGNVRELENIIERALVACQDGRLDLEDCFLTVDLLPNSQELDTLEEHMRAHILKVLELTGWRVSGPYGAANLLGLKRTTLESKMKRLNITRKK